MVPKPVQKPHPPLWMACSQLQTIERAGENGFGALGFQFVSADAAHAWVHAYYNAITKRLKKLADYQINPNMALVSFFMCAKTDEEARARADGATFFQFALRFYGASQNRQRPDPGTVNMWDEYNKWKRDNPEAQEAALRGGLIGSPETIAKKLRRFRSSHIDQVILLNQAGKNSHEHICESLELFAREVMPEFAERSRARGVEGRRHERRDPARGNRHRSLQGSLRQAGGERRQAGGCRGGVVVAPLRSDSQLASSSPAKRRRPIAPGVEAEKASCPSAPIRKSLAGMRSLRSQGRLAMIPLRQFDPADAAVKLRSSALSTSSVLARMP